ncbi:MAG TPA: SMC family ATPase [Thermoanaerobaculia bacterium]|nr:SMC family ATPase [Thermoanaerobaculia bacterium]
MRPKRLELEGFASFRERAVVDFGEGGLFALTGPTGSGKSSLIDAMTFALYGSVARYDDRKVVWPAITQGRQEARVRLDFEIGRESYTAVRVLRRSGPGRASTKEARLEHDGRVLAATEKQLTEAVEKLIGLPFEHFTRCVVLPQGEFAQFLHDAPKSRQDLLVELLDLDVYRRMAKAANERAAIAANEAAWRTRRLEQELQSATEPAREAARLRVASLRELAALVEAAAPRLAELLREATGARAEARAAQDRAARLAAVVAPPKALELAARLSGEKEREIAARAEVELATRSRQAAEASRTALRRSDEVRAVIQAHASRNRLAKEAAAARVELEAATAAERKSGKALSTAQRGVEEAQALREEALRENLASVLRETLRVGKPCPVCGVKVSKRARHEAHPGIEAADEALAAAVEARAAAEKELSRRGAEAAAAKERIEDRERRLAEAAAALEGKPAPAALEHELATIEQAEKVLEVARRREASAVETLTESSHRLAALEEEKGRAWRRFGEVRDPLAGLGAPPVERDDLARAWRELEAWAAGEAPRQRASADDRAARATAIEEERESVREELVAACADAGLVVGEREPRDACVAAIAAAEAELDRIDAAIAEANRLREEVKAHQESAVVAKSLGAHLGANRFEAWMLSRAIRGLLAAASQLLLELSSGQYSLAMDDKREFVVVDHASANEVRLARTLSGGETFLASLALALALSEHVSRLAARGAARLDALFLDEGFGALDPDTLEVVAGAIEELGARGHMVGIVTHVRELAERIPVRFEVTKDARTSRVEKVTD